MIEEKAVLLTDHPVGAGPSRQCTLAHRIPGPVPKWNSAPTQNMLRGARALASDVRKPPSRRQVRGGLQTGVQVVWSSVQDPAESAAIGDANGLPEVKPCRPPLPDTVPLKQKSRSDPSISNSSLLCCQSWTNTSAKYSKRELFLNDGALHRPSCARPQSSFQAPAWSPSCPGYRQSGCTGHTYLWTTFSPWPVNTVRGHEVSVVD